MIRGWLRCLFHAGLRIYDVADPYLPREIAYFVPPNPSKFLFARRFSGPAVSVAGDVLADNRGTIFLSTPDQESSSCAPEFDALRHRPDRADLLIGT